jgi:hypothetical protein
MGAYSKTVTNTYNIYAAISYIYIF